MRTWQSASSLREFPGCASDCILFALSSPFVALRRKDAAREHGVN
jgi:hypothetical protein